MLGSNTDAGIDQRPASQSTEVKRVAGVLLLTGVTGFVGKRLLVELLKETSGTIVCLVRASNELEAQRRGRSISKDLRVVFIAADLEEERLGLTEQAWDMLAQRVCEIYHCAASVSFVLPLAASRRINVDGTRTLLRLAKACTRYGQFRRLHHVSTAYVAGKRRGIVDAHYLPDHRNSGHFRNPYEQSKAEAEQLLRAQTEVPVTIYRPSIVAGDTHHGATDNFNVIYAPIRLIYKGSLPFLPTGGASAIDCVGVDYVVRGIVALGKISRDQCDSYHLTAGAANLRVHDVVRIANEESALARERKGCGGASVPCEVISPWRWNTLFFGATLAQLLPKQCRQLRRWGKLAVRGIRGFAPYEPYTQVNTIFDCESEIELLAAVDISQPPPLEYLRLITRYAIGAEFRSADAESGAAVVQGAIEYREAVSNSMAVGQTL